MIVKILHLYYDIMNLYGEYGNIKILEKHLEDQNVEVIVEKKTINDFINWEEYDFIYIGSGTEKNQKLILEDMKKNHNDSFKSCIEQGKNVLLTGNSYEILGNTIDGQDGLKILDFDVKLVNTRNVSDIIATSSIFENKIVGFVNNMSSIERNVNPLFDIEFGIGESKESKKEGIIYKNTIGTHLIGPLLVRNPEVLKYFVEKICVTKNEDFVYKERFYEEEEKAYEVVLKELESRSGA